ncbi:MAG: glycoside hydrolase family 16 protein [Candidatus Eremiobacterota bacterium]
MDKLIFKTLAVLVFVLFVSLSISAAEEWKPVWSDEFDYEGLPDESKWNYDTKGNSYGWGNNEAQWYTEFKKENACVSNGTLKITAVKESVEGKNYSSARLTSKGNWKYCKIEVKAKVPTGRGTWPAIWMMSTGNEYGSWPDSGEIDIMEQVGYNPEFILSSTHTNKYNHVKGTQKSGEYHCPDATSEFHVYGVEWEENQYRVYIDGIHYYTYENDGTGWQSWPFDKPFYLILNLAIGGNWGGKEGIDDSLFPQVFEIDYVRVYQKETDITDSK